ncbi:hypothetical protein HY989_02995 [Candidatus Micrarchaeota archaeon]|nr:hypothetical protein [Candidatus Micrarchaeota archaeon]
MQKLKTISNPKKEPVELLALSVALGIASFCFVKSQVYLKIAISLAAMVFPFAIRHLIKEYREDKSVGEMELEIPNLLLSLSSKPKGLPFEYPIFELSKTQGMLGKKFLEAKRQIDLGFSTEYAILAMIESCKSHIAKRAIGLILDEYRTGGDYKQAYLSFGSDLLQIQKLQSENATANIMQKYTLLASIGVLIPSIIAILIGFVSGIGFSNSDPLVANAKNEILPSIVAAIQIYLILLAGIGSAIIALQEGKLKKAPIYFCILSACSLLIFNLLGRMQLV